MLFIVNKDISEASITVLKKFGECLFFCSSDITYSGISNHPDIFLTQINTHSLVVSPNCPSTIKKKISLEGHIVIEGKFNVGKDYPKTAPYNAVITKKYLIHKLSETDETLLLHCKNLQKINVNQAYTRCNLLPLPNNTFITSDRGIHKTLTAQHIETLFVNPKPIQLKGFKYGFFGGCCGVSKEYFFFNGNINCLENASDIINFISAASLSIIELNNAHPVDIGSIFVLE